MINIGYACINLSLKKDNITTNRGMIKSTFLKKGLEEVSNLVILNLQDLIKILNWNIRNEIYLYRLSSDLFPWMSEYNITDLPQFNKIENLLKGIGTIVKKNNLRIGFHPGQFDILCSNNQDVVNKTIKDLNQHAEILDLMGLDINQYYSINIHIGASYNDKLTTLERFKTNFQLLSNSTKKRLVVENDDKINMYTVQDLYDNIHKDLNIPITFDYFHHKLNPGNLSEYDALKLCNETWNKVGIKQLCHYSSSRMINEDNTTIKTAHADWLYEKINTYDLDIDIECESKQKDLAILKYRKDYEV